MNIKLNLHLNYTRSVFNAEDVICCVALPPPRTFIEEWAVNCYLKETRGPGRQMKGAVSGSLFLSCG